MKDNILSEAAGQFRIVAGPDDFFDILDGIKAGQYVTIGYVTAAKVDYPKKKVLNNVTNRMNTVDDYAAFAKNLGKTGDVCGVIKLTIYNMKWQDRAKFTERYKQYKNTRDLLNKKYGFETNAARYKTPTNQFGNGIKQYNGSNAELAKHTYTDLNMYGIKPIGTSYFLTYQDGRIEPIDEAVLPLSAKKEITSLVQKFSDAGASEDEIAPLKNFDYRRFEHSHVLFVSATSDGIPTLFINTKLSDKVGNMVNINPNDLIRVAKSRYPKYTAAMVNENKKTDKKEKMKKRITINESELKRYIEEQVRRIVCESGHLYGHDSDGNVFTNSEETYRGVEGSRFISHGEWSDPEIWYNGKSANANDVEDMMWEYYKEECEERGVVPSDEEFDNLPAEWFKEHLDEYFSEL